MIYRNDNIKNGRPVVEGSKIGVHQVYKMSETTSVETIVEEFDNLTTDKVEYAIRYAKNNEDEMGKIEKNKRESLDELNESNKIYYIDKR